MKLGMHERSFFDTNKIDPSLIRQLSNLLEVGNDTKHSNEATFQVVHALQKMHKFKNQIRVGKIIEKQKELQLEKR